jgi:hypothetical protein
MTSARSLALRIGWTVLPHKLIDEVSQQKPFDDMGTTVLEQLTLARFSDAGGFTHNLRRMRATIAAGVSPPCRCSQRRCRRGVIRCCRRAASIRAAAALVRRADPRRGRPRPWVAHRRIQLVSVRNTFSAIGVSARL